MSCMGKVSLSCLARGLLAWVIVPSAPPSHSLPLPPSSPQRLIRVQLPGCDAFYLTPATLRRNDTSARSVNEWTGQ